jgi:glucoamylase
MEGSPAGASRLIPEQVWDGPPIPDLELFPGKPTGSACPLVWAHSEYIKLRRSLRDGHVFDQPPQTVQRYLVEKHRCQHFLWIFNNKVRSMPCGKTLRIAVLKPATVHWSLDGWKTAFDTHTRDTKLGVHVVDLPTDKLPVGNPAVFTLQWDADGWEGVNYSVTVE